MGRGIRSAVWMAAGTVGAGCAGGKMGAMAAHKAAGGRLAPLSVKRPHVVGFTGTVAVVALQGGVYSIGQHGQKHEREYYCMSSPSNQLAVTSAH